MDSNLWSRHGETSFGRAMWFPRTAPPARRGTDPERNEKFESGFLRQLVCLRKNSGAGDEKSRAKDPSFVHATGSALDGRRGRKLPRHYSAAARGHSRIAWS